MTAAVAPDLVAFASAVPSLLAQHMADPRAGWAPVVLMIIIGVGFAVGNVVLSILIGPRRTGPGKETTYESGMVPIGDTRKRFNVRFYIVAMIFLVIDVEIVFFYPWATIFPFEAQKSVESLAPLMLLRIGVFTLFMLVSYFYAWGKGIFRWD